ncbi:MAG: GTP-binding protein [Lentisphaerota bacterium]
MKIRRYKGHSLDKLYSAIQSEMGPEAVVVSTSHRRGAASFLAPLLGADPYELIAVVDDHATEKHLLHNTASSEEIERLSRLHTEKWERMESAVKELRGDIGSMARSAAGKTDLAREGIPGYALNWDPRFLQQIMDKGQHIFEKSKNAQRVKAVRGQLHVEETFPLKKERGPHIIVLTGPTGSGKTTTLAKLAARWSLDQKLKVGVITTDTFRIAAVDQIKEYATLLGLELRIAFSAGEAARAAQSFADKDVILVDTPGRNHYDQAGLTGLRGILQGMGEMTVLMLLPATVARQNVADIMESFQVLNTNYLVITKIDETKRFDALTSAAMCSSCPVVFLTDGQRVPQDIRPARMNELVEMLLPGEPS